MSDQAISIGTATPAQPRADARGWVGPLMVVFVISMLIPGSFDILGGTTLSASRLVVLVAIIPLTVAWLTGKAGRIILPDILMAAHAVWMLLAFVYNHGMERVPYGIITGIELFGGYLMGRILIRSPGDYRRFFSYMLVAFVILLPFALYEMQTSRAIMQTISRTLLGIGHGDVNHPPRWGLWRVQSVMQHPILFGVFCAFVVANAFYIWRDSFFQWLPRTGLAMFLTISSLSAGPLLAAVSQLLMILWGWITGNKWKTLVALSVAMYLFLSVASNRGPVVIIIETLTFSSETGWTRIHVYRHGMINIWANPIFGLGLHNWIRPGWLTPSVDNFWLLTAMRFGIVGFLLLAAALVLNLWNIIRVKNLSEAADRYRTGYMIGLAGLCFTLATVHVWGPTYVLTLFYFGAGVWLFVQEPETIAGTGDTPRPAATDGRSGPALRRLPPAVSRPPTPGASEQARSAPRHARASAINDPANRPRPSELPYRRKPATKPPNPYRKD
jgi:O-antigen ligase